MQSKGKMKEAAVRLEEESPKGFNLKVTYRDEDGSIYKKDPYILRVVDKRKLWERPVGSGNLWDRKNQPIGRWVNGKHDEKAEHIAFTPPETEDQKLARSVVEKDSKIKALEAELASMKAESKKKQGS